MKNLLYGVAYYPEYEPEYRTEKDLDMMKKAGFNVIRIAESTWSTWEKREGEYDFSILRNTLEAAQKAGMQVIVGTPTYAVPAWLVRKDPDVMVTTADGRALYGHRQLMNIINPTYRRACEQIIRHMLEVTRDYDCVIGYQLDNETKHYGTAGRQVQEQFVEYLKEKFGTVEAMNRAFGLAYWSNSIGCWEDMPDVRGTINGSLKGEFEKFQRKLAADFLMWQRKIVDEYRRPDQFVTHNLDFEWKSSPKAPFGYSYGVQPGINHLEASKALTLCGVDIYHPTQDDLTGAEIAFGGDSTRSLKSKPYMVLETEAQAFRYWTPYPKQLRLQAFSHLASGAIGVEYWHWHSIHNSFETYWKGVLSHDMEENAVYRECMTIGADFQRLSPYLQNPTKHNRIAFVTDNVSLTALEQFPIGDHPGEEGAQTLTYNDVVRRYYDVLYRMNLECDVIDVNTLPERASDYQMLVTPALYCASDRTISVLRKFVQSGGTLVSSFKSFFTDENMKVRYSRQPYGLTDVFGAYYQEFTRPGRTKLQGQPVTIWQELLIPGKTASFEKYEHKYWGEYAGIVRNDFGKGHAVYIGCWCSPDVLEKELLNAAKRAGISGESDVTFPIIVRTVTNDRNRNIHFLMNFSEEEKKILCPYENVRNLLSGQTCHAGQEIVLSDWDCAILMELSSDLS